MQWNCAEMSKNKIRKKLSHGKRKKKAKKTKKKGRKGKNTVNLIKSRIFIYLNVLDFLRDILFFLELMNTFSQN